MLRVIKWRTTRGAGRAVDMERWEYHRNIDGNTERWKTWRLQSMHRKGEKITEIQTETPKGGKPDDGGACTGKVRKSQKYRRKHQKVENLTMAEHAQERWENHRNIDGNTKRWKTWRWESTHNIKIDFTRTGWGDVSWSKLTQDTDRWWVPLNAVSKRSSSTKSRTANPLIINVGLCLRQGWTWNFILRRGDERGVSYYDVFFRGIRKISKSHYYLRHVCPSVRPRGTSRLPRDGVSLKSRQENGYFAVGPTKFIYHISLISS